MGSDAVNKMFQKHLLEEGHLHYGEFMNDLSRLIVSLFFFCFVYCCVKFLTLQLSYRGLVVTSSRALVKAHSLFYFANRSCFIFVRLLILLIKLVFTLWVACRSSRVLETTSKQTLHYSPVSPHE